MLTIVSVIMGIGVQLVGGVAPDPALFVNGLAATAFGAWRTIGQTAALASRMDSLFIIVYVIVISSTRRRRREATYS